MAVFVGIKNTIATNLLLINLSMIINGLKDDRVRILKKNKIVEMIKL